MDWMFLFLAFVSVLVAWVNMVRVPWDRAAHTAPAVAALVFVVTACLVRFAT